MVRDVPLHSCSNWHPYQKQLSWAFHYWWLNISTGMPSDWAQWDENECSPHIPAAPDRSVCHLMRVFVALGPIWTHKQMRGWKLFKDSWATAHITYIKSSLRFVECNWNVTNNELKSAYDLYWNKSVTLLYNKHLHKSPWVDSLNMFHRLVLASELYPRGYPH